jgi:integrase
LEVASLLVLEDIATKNDWRLRDNHWVYASIRALDQLLDSLPAAGSARRRQLGAFRRELSRALDLDGFRLARGGLTGLLDNSLLQRYFEVAESGALRDRLVRGGRPPTSAATNQARRDCIDIMLAAAGRPRLQTAAPPWGRQPDTRPAVAPRPTPEAGELGELRRRLSHALTSSLDPGRARFTAMIAMVLDTAARTGELAGQQVDDLDEGLVHVDVHRWPQHGTTAAVAVRDVLPLSALTTAALAQWLPARQQLTTSLQGAATALWVSLRANHSGLPDDQGRTSMRPPGLPLEERGLIRAFTAGRDRYELGNLLPPKLEQLRRATAEHLNLS